MYVCMYIYIYIYIYICIMYISPPVETRQTVPLRAIRGSSISVNSTVSFCGLDSGNSKFETVRTSKQHVCF